MSAPNPISISYDAKEVIILKKEDLPSVIKRSDFILLTKKSSTKFYDLISSGELKSTPKKKGNSEKLSYEITRDSFWKYYQSNL